MNLHFDTNTQPRDRTSMIDLCGEECSKMILNSERRQSVNEYPRLNPELKDIPSLPVSDPDRSSCSVLHLEIQ